ncbi:MAG: polysaccharide deacetylase family protein [Candidatus Omnitrophica bacterium]|nr:polysaccharide deacetylase family protein [Candidatus Omnitrophota bacterium]
MSASLIKFFSLYLDIPVLVYHSIKWPLSFKKQLEFLKRNSFEILNPNDFILKLNQLPKKSPKPSILLTFDDGYSDLFFNVFPFLLEFRFPALIFLTVDKISKEGYLTYEKIKEMLDTGLIYIGSHTLSHRYLPYLKDEEINFEIGESKRILEENLKTEINFFSYPWGGFNYYIKEKLKEAGYICAFTTNQGLSFSLKHKDLFAIKRLTVKENESFLKFFLKVSGAGYIFQKHIVIKDG